MPDSHETADDAAGSFDDIELAYREALKSLDDAEQQVGSALMELSDDDSADTETSESAFTSIGDSLARDLESHDEIGESDAGVSVGNVSPRSVIEAALFVGGDVALTARRLAALIGPDTDSRVAVQLIDQLNEEYTAENRPYEIQLHEGGFRLAVRESFDDVRAAVFGLGPREVRLSPEALEVLAWIAYNQPVTKEDLNELSQNKPLTIVRQLQRLSLIELQQTGKRRQDVVFKTGARFLKLFNLESIEDLPQADIFNFK